MKKPRKPTIVPPHFTPPDSDNDMDMESQVKEIWELLCRAQDDMLAPFPSHGDAFWYGSFSCLFVHMVGVIGEKEAGKIVGKKALKEFFQSHDEIVRLMFLSSHRMDVPMDAFDEIWASDHDEEDLEDTKKKRR